MYIKNTEHKQYKKRNHIYQSNSGFTLIEMVVTLVILSIMLTLSVGGLMAWQDWADFQKENEYAQTLFIAAQNQMSEFSADGRLRELQESLSGGATDDKTGNQYEAVGLNLTDSITSMLDENGNTYSLTDIFPESSGKDNEKLYQDEIVSLRAETGEYAAYLDDPEGLKASDPQAYWVFELLGAYVYDTSILNGSKTGDGSGNGAAICVEITPADGQVFAVLYSDRNDRFIYAGNPKDTMGSEEAAGVADIASRETSYRKDRMVGYYGVDTLYASTKNEMIRPSISMVKLYNKDTFYLTCRLSAQYRNLLTSQLQYEIDLDASRDVNDKKLTVTLDGTKLKNEANASVIDCPVLRYDEDGNKIELGEFPILAWVEPDYTVHVVFDAADVQATTYLYEKELDDIRSDEKAADTKFAKTLSFFRFGVEADNVYASVTASGEGFDSSKTASNFGNLNLFKNQSEKHTCFAGESTTTEGEQTAYEFSVRNARHLYNMRYIEDLSYEREAGSAQAAAKIKGVTFLLKSDIDWTAFQKDGGLHNSYNQSAVLRLSSLNDKLYDADKKVISSVTRYNCDFPSVSQLRERDVLDGNHKKISGIAVSEISNVLYQTYLHDKNGTPELGLVRPTGLINVNYGEIKDLQLDQITASGLDFVGGFCGINAGRINGLETANSKDNSLIAGRKHVGGIMGFEIPYADRTDIHDLKNNAAIEGVEAVGGIVGMIRSNFELKNVDWDELTGLTAGQKQLLTGSDSVKIVIRDCRNYGTIAGLNASDLREIYAEEGSEITDGQASDSDRTDGVKTADGKDPEEARYIGGIVGYCYNASTDDPEKLVVENCLSAPEYKGEDFLKILSDDDLLSQKLVGVYVGGIAGYNYYGQIKNCSTTSQKGKEGCLFGYRYVGGIVGYNIGPASVIAGSQKSETGENDNHVIANQYAGGIIGCNANVRDIDSQDHDISKDEDKDPENLKGLLLPDAERDLQVKIDHWINKGVVIAVDSYAGGITGYNAGYIFACNSDVKYETAEKYFTKLYSGNYAGGITGYNNGVIGNTDRQVMADGSIGAAVSKGSTFSTVCYVKGHNYVGGVVGYNDVDSVVEDYVVESGYVLGDEESCFVGGYAGFNASVDLLMNTTVQPAEPRMIHANPNRVKGTYFVGGTIGGNIINMADNRHVQEINGVFMTDNFLGTLEGREFVGGFIGYNLLFDNGDETAWIKNDKDGYLGGVYIVQRELLDAFHTSDASVSDAVNALLDKKEILDNITDRLQLEITASDKVLNISGREAESLKVSFGTITGDIYVGGVLGYNDDQTKLLIQNVENATPIEALKDVPYEEEQVASVDAATGTKTYRRIDYLGREMEYTYSYAGGIIGKVSEKTTLDDCWNASTGTVNTKGTYTGGLCEINEGVIKNCEVSNFGSSTQDYVGGLCGLNKGTIGNCSFLKKTVSGRNVVGGITTENFGHIFEITLSDSKMFAEGKKQNGVPEGVAGLYTAYNGAEGVIELENDLEDISITSGGKYVGAAAGINEGTLINKKAENAQGDDKQVRIRGSVRGYQTVGGLVGLNNSPDASQVVANYTNEAAIVATNGNAGGIIGENLSKNEIRACVNNAVVTASDEGNAGGITSSNDSLITECTDYKAVRAPEGMCGGIVALNKENGVIRDCIVQPDGRFGKLSFVSTKAVGGIAAQNAGLIEKNRLNRVIVTNETDVLKTSIGMIAGDNLKTGKIYLADSAGGTQKMDGCEVIVESNYSNAGGVAGTNAGKIQGSVDSTGARLSVISCEITLDRANIASIGGIAGLNTGSIEDVAVDSTIQGNLGSDTTGYGGIAGYSGYTGQKELQAARTDSSAYPVQILNCSFDGKINATGSSGAPVRVGGIAGINGYGSLLEDCFIGTQSEGTDGVVTEASQKTYITAGDYIHKDSNSYATTDTRSYAYLGGIAGDNYGKVSACDNAANSTDQVYIIGFAGETAGIVGYNYPDGIVSGYEDASGREHYLTTGKTWSVDQRCASNDRGPGGIIGKSDSAETMSYVINYAPVTSMYQANTYAAGLIGIQEQHDVRVAEFYKCQNYGDIQSASSAAGFVGMVRSNGAKFEDCVNYGSVHVKRLHAGGFVAMHHSFVAGFEFRNCANHGAVSSDGADGGSTIGGFVGKDDRPLSNANSFKFNETHFYDCVNTGIISRAGGTQVHQNAGSFYGNSQLDTFYELCRNYNTLASSANGFSGTGKNVYMKNCFDDSNTTTRDANLTPFGGKFNNKTNAYYLNQDSQTRFSHDDYGVYFSLHQALNDAGQDTDLRAGGFTYNTLRNNMNYFVEPNDSSKIEMNRANPRIKISLSYASESQGLDSFVVYFWNGSNQKNSGASGNYQCTATFEYADGTTYTTPAGSARGYYSVCDDSRVILKNSQPDKKPVSVQLDFTGGSPVRLRGFAFVPAADTGVEAVCSYLSNRTGMAFSIDKINSRTDKFDQNNLASDDAINQSFPNDVLDIDWPAYSNFGTNTGKGQTTNITFHVEKDDSALGMKAFVFYLANANRNSSAAADKIDEKEYRYYVTFTDVDGNSEDTAWENATGYDASVDGYREKSRVEVDVPDEWSKKIESFTLHIQPTNSGNVFFRGFAFIPVGQDEQKMASGTHMGASESLMDQKAWEGGKNLITRLLVDKSQGRSYVYLPYNYQIGYYMDEAANDPIGNTYYNDHTSYNDSLTKGKDTGSRIDTYYDLDPKFVSIAEGLSTVYRKLQNPTQLAKQSEQEGRLYYTWERVQNAYAFQYYYEIYDKNGTLVETSDKKMVGSLERVVDVKIKDSWEANNYRIRFYVRAINAYHMAHDDPDSSNYDPDYEKYDSDWVNANDAVIKKALPRPEVHIEFVAGNRAVFVLDNYEEYQSEECTDCRIYVSYNNKDYSFNLADGEYTKPVTLDTPNNEMANIICYATPNASIQDYYLASENFTQSGEAHGSNHLPNNDRYCDTSFGGFYGTEADNMEYQVVFKLRSQDAYLMTDISAYDEVVGATVAYDSEVTHAANSTSGGSTVQFTSTLKNLPKEWFSKDNVPKITVRAYPYRSQYEIIHYGHEVAEGISLESDVAENRAKLAGIYDDSYIPADGDERIHNCVWDEQKNDLKPGYVLQKQGDGTYNLYYSAVIEMSMTNAAAQGDSYREYSKYEVDYCIYSSMNAETAGTVSVNSADYQESYWSRGLTDGREYNTAKTDSNERKYVQEMQSVPLVDTAVAKTDNQGRRVYTFKWDTYYQDISCFNTNSQRYQEQNDKYITNVPQTMFATWDSYLDKQNRAGLGNITNSDMRRLMNAYYSSYSTAQYRIELVGTTMDGKEVILSMANVDQPVALSDVDHYENADQTTTALTTKDGTATSYHVWNYEYSFTDADHTWDSYPVITARIMRLGSLKSVKAYNYNNGNERVDTNGAVYILPRYTECSLTQKMKFSTISKPDVVLHRENGQFITDDMVYDVSFGGIADERQLEDLGGYLIKVKTKTTADGKTPVETHYYYIKDCQNHQDDMDLDLDELGQDGVVVDVTADYSCEDHNCSTKINLSDFNTNDVVEISVQAIARKKAGIYETGNDGVAMELTIPNRLHVPDASKLSKVWAAGGSDLSMTPAALDVYAGGIAFGYASDDYPDVTDAEVELAVALYDTKPDGAENDKSVVADQINPDGTRQSGFDAGAVKVLYGKDAPLSLGKVAESPSPAILDLTQFERYPGEYAGKWLKIAAKAASANRIDSQWSDKDRADETVNYIWIQLPKLLLNNVEVMDLGTTETGDITRYACDGQISDVSVDTAREVTVSTRSLSFAEEHCADGYRFEITGLPSQEGEAAPVYTIYLQRHLTDALDASSDNGMWDVYQAADTGAVPVTPADGSSIPVCDQDTTAVYIGTIGRAFADASQPEAAPEMIEILNLQKIAKDYNINGTNYSVNAQLRYQFDAETNCGNLILVLPDMTRQGEVDYDDSSDYFTTAVSISQYIRTDDAGNAFYVAGMPGIYQKN